MSIHGDGHVHIYPAFELDTLLEAAAARSPEGEPLLLCLTEAQGVDAFGALARSAAGARDDAPPRWASTRFWIRPTREACSLGFGRVGSAQCAGYLVAGRQIVSSEEIEVLALAPAERARATALADRTLALDALVRNVRGLGAAAVLPWGLGKWIGRRGRRVAEVARDPEWAADPLVLLGDSAHRFWPWPTPSLHRAPGARVLPGTDPLPLRGSERRVGSYGFRLDAPLDPGAPAAALLEGLRRGAPLAPLGRPASFSAVLVEQIRYRLRAGEPVGTGSSA